MRDKNGKFAPKKPVVLLTDYWPQGIVKPEPEIFDFGKALELMKKGHQVGRRAWYLKSGIAIKKNICREVFTNAVFLIVHTDGTWDKWQPNQEDMVSEDWELIA